MIYAERQSTIINAADRDIHITITDPRADRPLPAVLLLHGFKGFRNWGFFPMAAQHLADAGTIAVRMDTSLNGMRGTNDRVVDVEDFARNTISHEVEDVFTCIEALTDLLGSAWNGTLHIVGHSRGGGLAHIVGRQLLQHPLHHVTLGTLVVWNSIGQWERWTPRQRDVWMRDGHVTVENARTGQQLRMNATYVMDIEDHAERFDITAASRDLAERIRYVHAEQDVTVSLKEIEGMLRATGMEGRLERIPNTGHTFGVTHPIELITPAFALVLEKTTTWLHT